MSQPRNRVCFSRTGAVLDQVILCGTVHTDIGENFTNDIQLMVAGENEVFRPLDLAGPVIDFLLHLNKNELANEVQDGILRQNVLPHIGHAVFVLKSGIPRTGSHTLAVAHVKGQEECGIPGQFGGHINFFQIHGKVYKAARLK